MEKGSRTPTVMSRFDINCRGAFECVGEGGESPPGEPAGARDAHERSCPSIRNRIFPINRLFWGQWVAQTGGCRKTSAGSIGSRPSASERACDFSGEPLNPVPFRMEEGGEPPKGVGHGRQMAGELSPPLRSKFVRRTHSTLPHDSKRIRSQPQPCQGLARWIRSHRYPCKTDTTFLP